MDQHKPSRRLGRPALHELADVDRRQRILEVAGDHFGRRGYAAVSLSDIAADVGVTKAALYHHFASKDMLYTAMMIDILGTISAVILTIVQTPSSFRDKVRQLAHMMIMQMPPDVDRESMMRDVAEHLSDNQQREIIAAFGQVEAAFELIMRDGIARGELRPHDPRLMAHALWQLLEGFSGRRGRQARFQGQPEVVDAVVDLFLHGALQR